MWPNIMIYLVRCADKTKGGSSNNKTISLPGLAIIVILLFQIDIYASNITGSEAGLNHYLGISNDRITALFNPFACFLLLMGLIPNLYRLVNCREVHKKIIAIAVTISVGVFHGLISGKSIIGSLRTIEVSGILVLLICYCTAFGQISTLGGAAWVRTVFVLPSMLRLLECGVLYLKNGGVSFVEGVISLTADGQLLTLWCFTGAFLALYSSEKMLRKQYLVGTFSSLAGLILIFAIAASFRRNAMLRILIMTSFGFGVKYILSRGLVKGAILGISISSVMAMLIFGALVLSQGYSYAFQRVLSLSSQGDGQFSSSNELYNDDWVCLIEAFYKTVLLGVGPGKSYGVVRVAEFNSSTDFIPLHTGSFELFASYGIFGALPFYVFLIGCLGGMLRQRVAKNPKVLSPIEAVSIAYVLFIAIWPFGPPFYTQTQTCVILGVAAAVVTNWSTSK